MPRWSRWSVSVVFVLAVAVLARSGPARHWIPALARPVSWVDAVSAATKPGASVVGLVTSDYERLAAPMPRDVPLDDAHIEAMVRYAVTLAGGLRNQLEAGAEWVVIKPNIVELQEAGSGVITDWRVVKAVVKLVHEAAPQARITIAEGGAWVPPERTEVLQNMHGGGEVGDGFAVAGYRQLLQDPALAGYPLDLVDLNFDQVAEVAVPDGGYVFPKYFMPNTILECDFLISVPVLKIIGSVGMTNAMKNFVGVAPGMIYGWPKMSGYPGSGSPGLPHDPGILDEVIVDLVATAEPDFAVVDALVGMERAKTDTDGGMPVRLNTVLASADVVAADAVSAQLIGLNPDDIEYLTLAAYRGLGQEDLTNIKVKGTPMESALRRFEKYGMRNGTNGEYGTYGQGSRTWLLKGPFPIAQVAGGSEAVDPTAPAAALGTGGWSDAVYFHDDRIDLDKYFKNPTDCVAYAFCTFTAPKDQAAELWVGSDEGLKVWINGAPVYQYEGRRRHRLPNERVPVQLRAGENGLLVRVDQGRGRYEFSLNLCEVEPDARYAGNRVWGLRFGVPAAAATVAGSGYSEQSFEPATGEIPADARLVKLADVPPRADPVLAGLDQCLRAAGVTVSDVNLAGVTGHAFRFGVADSVGAEGLIEIDLAAAADLYRGLGVEVQQVQAADGDPAFASRQQEAFQLISASLDRGVPALCRQGTWMALVQGYHAELEQCYVAGRHGDLQPIDASELGMDERGTRLQVLTIGPARPVDATAAARRSVELALAEAKRPAAGRYHFGLDAYRCWLADVDSGRVARGGGLRMVAAALAERRGQAGPYLREVAPLFPTATSGLQTAAALYEAEAAVLAQVSALFPMMNYRGPGGGGRGDDRRPAMGAPPAGGPPGTGPAMGAPPAGGVPGMGPGVGVPRPAGASGPAVTGTPGPAGGEGRGGAAAWQSRSAEARRQAVPLIRQALELEQQAVTALAAAAARM